MIAKYLSKLNFERGKMIWKAKGCGTKIWDRNFNRICQRLSLHEMISGIQKFKIIMVNYCYPSQVQNMGERYVPHWSPEDRSQGASCRGAASSGTQGTERSRARKCRQDTLAGKKKIRDYALPELKEIGFLEKDVMIFGLGVL